MSKRRQTKDGTATFTYWMCIDITNESTPFQGFPRAVVETTSILQRVVTFPASIFELYVDKSRAGFGRMHGAGIFRIKVLDRSRLTELRLYPENPFSVFISNAQTFDAVQAYQRSSDFPLLHTTMDTRPGVPKFESLERSDLKALFGRVLSFLERAGEPEMILLPKVEADLVTWEPEHIGLSEMKHGVTIPNEMALKSLGFQLAVGVPLPSVVAEKDRATTATINAPFIRILCESVEAIRVERERFAVHHEGPEAGPPVDAIIWASGVGSRLSISSSEGANLPEGLALLLRSFLRQRDYAGLTNQSPESLKKILGSTASLIAIGLRKLELQLSTAAIGVLAASYFAPVVRVRPAVNLFKGRLKQLSVCATGASPRKARKLSKLSRDIGTMLREEIGKDCMKLIEESGENLKLFTNSPLELLQIQNLPLQLRFTVSRTPITPGPVFLRHAIGDPGLYVRSSDLKSVLIIRSFEDGDPIRNYLAKASSWFLEAAKGQLDLRVVDIRSSSDFVDALNSFSGQIVIFDGHGVHDEKSGVGALRIGSLDVNPLELEGKIHRMPPIVVLSTCSTHPLDWSEESSAMAFLMLGAVSVLATVTPILARDAAIFTGRLLLRLADFVPLIAGTGRRWSDVITGLLRMSYATDVIRTFEKARLLSDEDSRSINYDANLVINLGRRDWFESVLHAISGRTGMSHPKVERFWQENAYFTSALQYVHLGSPERIVIVGDDREVKIQTS